MKTNMKKIYLIAVALVAFATASFAQCDYDQQTGTIKIWKPDPTSIEGKFSVGDTKQIRFSRGNLQYNSGTQKWQFAAHQYDYIGNAAGNTSITVDGKANNTGVADLFGWVGASSIWTGLKQYGLTSSQTTRETDGYGNSASEEFKSNWGTLMGSKWRVLNSGEYLYLFNTRSGDKAATVNNVPDTRYAKATINTDGVAVKGIILFPDGGTFASSEFTAVGSPNTANADYTTTCTSAQWIALEEKGCVFLPAAGRRYGTTVSETNSYGNYWSSGSNTSNIDNAYYLYFSSSEVTPGDGSTGHGGQRYRGSSVRLVKNVE